MSSPGQSSGTSKAAELFEDLWRQLGECHQNALQGNRHEDGLYAYNGFCDYKHFAPEYFYLF